MFVLQMKYINDWFNNKTKMIQKSNIKLNIVDIIVTFVIFNKNILIRHKISLIFKSLRDYII